MPVDTQLTSLATLSADIIGRFQCVDRITVFFIHDVRDIRVDAILSDANNKRLNRADLDNDHSVIMLRHTASTAPRFLIYDAAEDVEVRVEATRTHFLVGLSNINSCCTKQIVWPSGQDIRPKFGIQRYFMTGAVAAPPSGHEAMTLAEIATLDELRRHPISAAALDYVRRLCADEDILDEISALDGRLSASARHHVYRAAAGLDWVNMHIAAPDGTDLVELISTP